MERKKTRKEKYRTLLALLQRYGSVAVAFSGGVDSTFLLTAAVEALGRSAAAVFVDSPVVMERERMECLEFCEKNGVTLLRRNLTARDLGEVWKNGPDRCYHCKRLLFEVMKEAAGDAILVEGTNVDDLGDYRPGIRALRELGIRSPLLEAGYTKDEIREELKERGMPIWEKPAYACLASRIPYGQTITEEKLKRIDEAEQGIRSLGFRQVRVRHLEYPDDGRGAEARIEVSPEAVQILKDPDCFERAEKLVKAAGFETVTVDPEGYRKGKMNGIFQKNAERTGRNGE